MGLSGVNRHSNPLRSRPRDRLGSRGHEGMHPLSGLTIIADLARKRRASNRLFKRKTS